MKKIALLCCLAWNTGYFPIQKLASLYNAKFQGCEVQ